MSMPSDTDDVIEDVKRLTLQPGDTLVLRASQRLSPSQMESLTEHMKRAFPDHQTIVLADGLDLTVVAAPAE